MQIPVEITDAITSFVEAGDYVSWADEDDSHKYKIKYEGGKKRLSTLPMVNKAFCQSASPRLFQQITATFSVPRLARLRELSISPYATYVRHIEIGIYELNTWAPDSKVAIYAEDLIGLLSPCLARFSNLRCLEFIGGGKYTQETKSKLVASVTSALRYVNMPMLEELDLSFPIAHDFGQLFHNEASSARIPIGSVLRRLRHLGLHVQEWTSQHGQRYRTHPVTPEHAALPNETFAVNIFKLISLAENIQSLEIGSTNILDLDNATFPPSLRLRSLCLSSVSISANILLCLMDNWRDSIRSIRFWGSKLNAGTWKHVLVELSLLPVLIDFQIESSGYSSTGTSAELRLMTLPESNDPQQLETVNFSDVPALAILQHRVNANRIAAGLPKISRLTYQAAEMYSMRSAMAILNR